MEQKYLNPIWIAGPIDNQIFFVNFTGRFADLINATNEGDVITVFINSPGGDTQTALGIYDLIAKSNRKTLGVVSGVAQSGASLILQACTERLITENSTLMLHRSTVQLGGSVVNAEETLKTFKSYDDQYYKIYAVRSGDKVQNISDMAHKDKYFTATQALEAGLVDRIIK
jgi:ATP-dependent Clp protease protease subunit